MIRTVAAAAALLLGLSGVWLWQSREAARDTSSLIASSSLQTDSHFDRALRLGVLASLDSWLAPSAPEAHPALVRASFASRGVAAGEGHTAPVRTISLSPDGSRVATGSDDETARIWDTATAAEIHRLELDGTAAFVGFAGDGSRGIVVVTGGETILWDLVTGDVVQSWDGDQGESLDPELSDDRTRLVTAKDTGPVYVRHLTDLRLTELTGHEGPVYDVALSPTEPILAPAGNDGTARIWDLETAEELLRLPHEQAVLVVEFSPDSHRIVTTCEDHVARVWDVRTGRLLTEFSEHTDWVHKAAFFPDGARVATAGFDDTARVWRVEDGSPLTTISNLESVSVFELIRAGTALLTAGDDGLVRLWDVSNGAEVERLAGHDGAVDAAASAVGGKMFATAGRDAAWRLWDLDGGTPSRVLEGHESYVWSVAASPVGEILATGSTDGTARVWDPSTGAELASLSVVPGAATSVDFLPDGRLVTGGHRGVLQVWAPPAWTEVLRIPVTQYDEFFVAVSPAGSSVAVPLAEPGQPPEYNGTTLLVFDLEAGAERTRLETHGKHVTSAAFSPDGATLATSSSDGTACLWEIASGEKIRCFEGHRQKILSVAFSPDGTRLVTAGLDESARVWNVVTGEEALPPLTGHQGTLLSAVFSPDQTRIATAGQDRTARIWDAVTGIELGVLKGHREIVSSVRFADDEVLVTASWDRTVRTWDVAATATPDLARQVCDPRTGKLRGALRFVTSGDAELVPLLDGRVGEDVCSGFESGSESLKGAKK